MQTRISMMIAALMCTATAMAAAAAEPMTNAGRLTCTIEPIPAGATQPERDALCNFQPIAGVASNYKGTVKRIDGPPLVDANLVFVWTVLAPKEDLPPGSLSGRYLSSLSDDTAPSATKLGGLRRESKTVPIELRAVTSAGPAAGDDRSIVLELDLTAAKA